jgi:transcriptional regulator
MYLPPQFVAKDDRHALELMQQYPLASLISIDDAGFPFVSHIPLHVDVRGAQWVLQGHCAKANPHWHYLKARPKAAVSFMGPQAYMSPNVYPDLVRVPTWSYLAVQCTVQARLLDEPQDKELILKNLIKDHDPAYEEQWRDLDVDFQKKMLSGVVAFELDIIDSKCKIKLNQHRPESHASLYNTYAHGNDAEQALSRWMLKLGLVPT